MQTASAPPAPGRTIAWNGIQFTLPPSWEVIVAGSNHLLVELSFLPILEIRWDCSGKGSPDDIVAAAIRRLAEGDRTVHRWQLPEILIGGDKGGAVGLGWQAAERPDGLVWQCPECGTVIFCRLFQRPEVWDKVAGLLRSLRCCKGDTATVSWSIQDFRLTLPEGFRLLDYTFAAGLSRLGFSGPNLELQFCRLAPASDRLAQRTLSQVLTTLLAVRLPLETLTDMPHLHECRTAPSRCHRIWQRLRRRRPFSWGRIWHDASHNRLLALTAAGAAPINLETMHHLCARYEIVSQE